MSLFSEEPVNSSVGYFAGRLGQTIHNGRWTLIRKLGWGPRSSTWLAVDSQNSGKIEAIKVYTVSASEDPSSMNERDILQKLSDLGVSHRLAVQKGSFHEESSRGRHLCLVLCVLGPSIVSLLDDSAAQGRYLPLHIVKQVAAEILEALCLLHRNKIIHGAVTPDNILLPSYQQRDLLQEFLSENPPNSAEEVMDGQGKVHQVVKSQPLNTYELKRESTATDFASVSLYLSNYSHARITSENVVLDAPSCFLPPEASIDRATVGTKADIWMLGCTIYTLIVGHTLFEDAPGRLSSQKLEGVIAHIESEISATKGMSAKDAKDTASLIKACLNFNPAERPDASDLGGYDWVEDAYTCSCGGCLFDA